MKRYDIRHGRKVTAGDLRRLQTSQQTHRLYCRRCHGTYSADHRDYFNARDSSVFGCCGVNNWLVTKRWPITRRMTTVVRRDEGQLEEITHGRDSVY